MNILEIYLKVKLIINKIHFIIVNILIHKTIHLINYQINNIIIHNKIN